MIRDRRKVGDQSDFEVFVDYGESVNLAGATKTFRMTSLDLGSVKVNNLTALAEDVTAERGGAKAPPLSYWRLYYSPAVADVNTKGDYAGSFTVVFGGGIPHHYPKDSFILISIEPR